MNPLFQLRVRARQAPPGRSRRGLEPQRRSARASLRGLTLIEMVGVLAVMSILAALAFPALIRQVDRANTTREKVQLAMMSDALTRSVTRTTSVSRGSRGCRRFGLALCANRQHRAGGATYQRAGIDVCIVVDGQPVDDD